MPKSIKMALRVDGQQEYGLFSFSLIPKVNSTVGTGVENNVRNRRNES